MTDSLPFPISLTPGEALEGVLKVKRRFFTFLKNSSTRLGKNLA
jgi:hypothetical protein